ncbi:Ig-like domain-containing protein [Salinisphaera sp. SPP-AMP-43]|uniref:Ig-like domain-containing protein n=1 Tax=Salinisphaera sp. SPP-AMP-43 TaxID=3121288 RepID=UPI003C6E1902
MLPTFPLTVDLNAPTKDSPLAGATVVALLDRDETDGTGYVVRRRVEAKTDNSGKAVLSLWPNTRGSGQSQYVLFAVGADNTSLFEVFLHMPARACSAAEVTGPPIPKDVPLDDQLRADIQAIRAQIVNDKQAIDQSKADAQTAATSAASAANQAGSRADQAGTQASAAAASAASAHQAKQDIEGLLNSIPNGGPYMLPPPTSGGPYVATADGQWVALSDYLSDTGGNTGSGQTVPTITLDDLSTNVASPALSGTVSDAVSTVTVVITAGGNTGTYRATNNGDGTWRLAAGALPSLAAGSYSLIATVTNSAGTGQDAATLTIATQPALTVSLNDLVTTDDTPTLTGAVSDPNAQISVDITPRQSLAVTISDLNTNDSTPTLSGTVNNPAATIDVEVVPA